MPTQAQLDELDAIIALLKEHPERHYQQLYAKYIGKTPPIVFTPELDCGSAFCIAGATVARAGLSVHWYKGFEDEDSWIAMDVFTGDGAELLVSIFTAARKILGLSITEADNLFRGENSMEDIERVRASLTVSDVH